MIAKGFVFEVSSQSLKRREPKKMEIWTSLFSRTCLVNNVSRLASHIFGCLLLFLYRCSPLYRNSTTILVHRKTVHMWRWFHGLMSLVYTNKPSKRRHLKQSRKFDPKKKKKKKKRKKERKKHTLHLIYDSVPSARVIKLLQACPLAFDNAVFCLAFKLFPNTRFHDELK